MLDVNDRLRSRWVCVCRLLKIEADLSELLWVGTFASFQDRNGRPQYRFDSEWALRGKIQPADADVKLDQGRRELFPTHLAYLERFVRLRAEHGVRDEAGRVYRVLGYTDSEEIDRLPAVGLRLQ